MTTPTKIRSRIWNMMLYPENPSHMQAIEYIRKEFKYVAILHGNDTFTEEDEKQNPEHKAGQLKKAHMHFVIRFAQARWNTALASTLGIETRWMEPCRDFNNSAVYLLHEGKPDKYQYDASELEGPLVPAVMKLLVKDSEDERVLELVNMIRSMGHIEYEDLIIKACENGLYSDLRRMGYLISKVVESHNLKVSADAYKED